MKAWDLLRTLTSFVLWICCARARRSASERFTRCIVLPPGRYFTMRLRVGVKKLMSTYLAAWHCAWRTRVLRWAQRARGRVGHGLSPALGGISYVEVDRLA
jgi:hypothetical protein